MAVISLSTFEVRPNIGLGCQIHGYRKVKHLGDRTMFSKHTKLKNGELKYIWIMKWCQ